MDKIDKALSRLSKKEKQKFKEILSQIESGSFQGLDFKKLKARDNIFRIRKGNMRIIFSKRDDFIKILSLERRSSKTYRRKRI